MPATTAVKDRITQGTWTVDRAHSGVTFTVEHAGLSLFHGSFKDVDARLVVGEGAELTGTVRVDSIDVEDENIRPHLLSPEFFDAERYPEIRFASSELLLDGDEAHVVGELEIAGTQRTVEARGRLRGPIELGGANKLALALETTIDRTEFGMDWQMELPNGGKALADDVAISVELELARE